MKLPNCVRCCWTTELLVFKSWKQQITLSNIAFTVSESVYSNLQCRGLFRNSVLVSLHCSFSFRKTWIKILYSSENSYLFVYEKPWWLSLGDATWHRKKVICLNFRKAEGTGYKKIWKGHGYVCCAGHCKFLSVCHTMVGLLPQN